MLWMISKKHNVIGRLFLVMVSIVVPFTKKKKEKKLFPNLINKNYRSFSKSRCVFTWKVGSLKRAPSFHGGSLLHQSSLSLILQKVGGVFGNMKKICVALEWPGWPTLERGRWLGRWQRSSFMTINNILFANLAHVFNVLIKLSVN